MRIRGVLRVLPGLTCIWDNDLNGAMYDRNSLGYALKTCPRFETLPFFDLDLSVMFFGHNYA